jgi:hypothetical protein
MRLGIAVRLLKQAGFKHFAINLPPRPDGLDTSELEVLVTHPVHGKCTPLRIPIFPREEDARLGGDRRSRHPGHQPVPPACHSKGRRAIQSSIDIEVSQHSPSALLIGI